MAHYELLKMTVQRPGAIAEFGVFKGVSFVRWAMMRDILGMRYSKKIIGFDTFGDFPPTMFEQDQNTLAKFINSAGNESISQEQLMDILRRKQIDFDVELVQGDILCTLPQYLQEHPEMKFSFINLDTDIYEPAVCILENCWDKIVEGGVLALDDYNFFAGENKAVDDFFQNRNVEIKCFPFAKSPSYIIK